MKKILLTLTTILALSTAYAQTTKPKKVVHYAQTNKNKKVAAVTNTEYNRWSLEASAGVNKFQSFGTAGYFQESPSLYNADLGVRYMFNNKFGLKLDTGFYNMVSADNSLPFKSNFYRANIQGVANLGRVMNFETWTNTLGLLAHLGVGYGQLKSDRFDGTDGMYNFLVGVTAQVKLSKRLALTGDFTAISTGRQEYGFAGNSIPRNEGLQGSIFQGSIGLALYLGSKDIHADWVISDSVLQQQVADVQNRLASLEAGLTDSDQDGVPDMFDVEPNSMAGVAVDNKGRVIDRNANGVADELERYFDKKYSTASGSGDGSGSADLKSSINDGYVNVYFNFNATTPTKESVSGINFLVTYLKANPTAVSDVTGYADELGNSNYNKILSQKRAEYVKQILVDSGIEASRLTIIANGEDASVNKASKEARQIVRRVTFTIK